MTYKHLNDLTATACFSDCRKFRFRLDITDQQSKGSETICVIMQNPSEADANKADRSVQFLERLVFKKQCDIFKNVCRMIVVNQFAFIQKAGFKGSQEHIGVDNDRIIREAIQEADIVLIAWGKTNPYHERRKVIYRMLADDRDKKILVTKKHPSRGFHKDFIQPLEIHLEA